MSSHTRIFRSDVLLGRVALITGGGTGIGAAIARELGAMGATIVISSRKLSNIEPAAAGLSAELGRTVFGEIGDIRDREATETLARRVVEKHGAIDILVNNGGGQFLAPAATITPRGWDAVINTNLTGTWNATRAVADAWMLDHGGIVISVTMLTLRGFPGMAHSVAARSGVEAMTRTLAIEWAAANVRLNCVAPGFIASSGLKRYPDGENMAFELQRQVPLKRLGTCDEVSGLVGFLASPAASYITGQTFIVDGGASLWGNPFQIPDPDVLPRVEIAREPWES